MMKKITVVIPTYNEEENIPLIYDRVTKIFKDELQEYDYEIQYIDNYSLDSSRTQIEKLIVKDKHVKAIYNAKNFGFTRSTFYGLTQAEGDCAILIFADMQDPPEVIPEFVKQWEQGYKIVTGIKNNSKESPIMYWLRKQYYKFIKKISEIEHIEQYDGFGLYDKSFIQVIRKLDDPLPYLRGIVAELGTQRKDVYYTQDLRKNGKSSFRFLNLYDQAMLGITSYSKVLMRIATLFGFLFAVICVFIALITLVCKLIWWDSFAVGNAAISIGVFFIGGVQIFFIGFLGEYMLNMNTRMLHRPLVIEEKRLNFIINEFEKKDEE